MPSRLLQKGWGALKMSEERAGFVWHWYVAPVEVRTAGGRQKMGWSMLHCSEWRSTEGRWVECCYSEQKKQISQ